MPIEFQYPQKCLLKLLIGERVTEWIYRTVEITQPIGDVVQDVYSGAGSLTEPYY